MSTPEKWAYHTEIYALRRVILGVVHDEHTSPVDTDGKWFNADLVEAAERRLRDKHAKQSEACKADTEARNAIRFADAERWRNSPEGKEHLLGSRPNRRRVRPADYGLTATEIEAAE